MFAEEKMREKDAEPKMGIREMWYEEHEATRNLLGFNLLFLFCLFVVGP